MAVVDLVCFGINGFFMGLVRFEFVIYRDECSRFID